MFFFFLLFVCFFICFFISTIAGISHIREALKRHLLKRKGPTLSTCWSNVLTHSLVFMVHSLRRPSEPLKGKQIVKRKEEDGLVNLLETGRELMLSLIDTACECSDACRLECACFLFCFCFCFFLLRCERIKRNGCVYRKNLRLWLPDT